MIKEQRKTSNIKQYRNEGTPFHPSCICFFQYIQVGDGGADHAFWGRAEDMHMGRPAYKIHPGAPGSDAAGNTVAALAIGAVVFKEKGQRI